MFAIAHMIQLTNVCKTYGDNGAVQALHDLSLTVEQGERVAVMGPSGSGKSTLLNLICGLDEPTSGSIKLEGIELSALDDDRRTRLRREKLGMIFQTFNLLPTLTALENVALPLRLQGLRRRETEERAAAMLERVGLKVRSHHRPDELSGGERQRVAIARATIMQPSLLLADEPTGNLDRATGREVMNLLEDLHESGVTLIMVTHDPELGGRAHRQLKMLDGAVVAEQASAVHERYTYEKP
jgi:putative ABC transport system ATP-binding protein